MAQASKKHFGPGAQGKGTGVGGMTDNKAGTIEDNMVLSNRDKSRHSDERGQDSKWIGDGTTERSCRKQAND